MCQPYNKCSQLKHKHVQCIKLIPFIEWNHVHTMHPIKQTTTTINCLVLIDASSYIISHYPYPFFNSPNYNNNNKIPIIGKQACYVYPYFRQEKRLDWCLTRRQWRLCWATFGPQTKLYPSLMPHVWFELPNHMRVGMRFVMFVSSCLALFPKVTIIFQMCALFFFFFKVLYLYFTRYTFKNTAKTPQFQIKISVH